MRVIALIVLPLLLLACTAGSESPQLVFGGPDYWCEKEDIQFSVITLGDKGFIQNDGTCTFAGSVLLNGEYRGAGGIHYPDKPAEFFELVSFIHKTSGARFNPFTHSVVKCEVDWTFPRMKGPCGVHLQARQGAQESAKVENQSNQTAPSVQGPDVTTQPSLEGESPQRPIVMTYYQLQDLLLGDDPGATIETLNGNWVQITGPTNGRGGQGGGPSDRNRPEYLTYTLVMNEFGPSMYPKSIAITCWSRQGDTRIKDFRTPPKREVTIIGIYEQSRALFPKLKSCQVLQDGSNSDQSLAPR